MMDYFQDSDKLLELITDFGIALASALAVLIIGLFVIKKLTNALRKYFDRKDFDESLETFLLSLSGIALKLMLFVVVIQMLGVQSSSLVAVLGAAGLAVGLALSGTLQNFAGGVMILIFKPFKVGDYIDAQGHAGTVSEVQIFNTILKTPDNKTIIVPNGGLANGSMVNYSAEPTRRVDWTFGIAYGDDADKAQAVIRKLMNDDARILQDPAPFVELGALADSSVNFTVRAWVNTPDYWAVHFDMNKKIYQTFAKEGLSIPFPQMDVHVHNN
jgi:small conductance mechanosensitive channel